MHSSISITNSSIIMHTLEDYERVQHLGIVILLLLLE